MKRLEQAFHAINRWMLIGMLAVMSVIIFCNVVLRYTTNESIEWAEEVSRHLMIWVTFIGAGPVLRHHAVEPVAPAARGADDPVDGAHRTGRR